MNNNIVPDSSNPDFPAHNDAGNDPSRSSDQRPQRKRGGRRRGKNKNRQDGPNPQSHSDPHNRPPSSNPRAVLPKRLRTAGPGAALSDKAKQEIFDTKHTFADLGLSPSIIDTLNDVGFIYPTAIQAQIIPLILSGKDVLGQARTGTGKTAAFGLPMLDRLTPGGDEFQGLVLVPTRELCIQVATDLSELGEKRGLYVLPVYGGQNIKTQAQLLARKPEIIVATPGRVMDMANRGYVHYRNIRMVVLDEVDRMLDIGFREDIRKILKTCPPHPQRQTVFVSATISGEIESLARSYATNAEKIVASAGSLTAAMVKQLYLAVQPWDKKALLRHLLTHEEPALTVVFCRMKRTVDEVAAHLNKHGIESHAMHGDMYQNKRNKVIEQLRAGKLSVLVASDLASRGLDVEGITHVINYDLPEDPDLYVHRVGRTARAGRDGVAWSLVTPEQGSLLTQIERLINAEIPKLDYPDFRPGPVPQGVLASQQLDQKRQKVARSFNRFAASPTANIGHVEPAAADPSKFPGGVIPTKLPDRRLGGRVKTARSMKAAISQTLLSPPPPSHNPSHPTPSGPHTPSPGQSE